MIVEAAAQFAAGGGKSNTPTQEEAGRSEKGDALTMKNGKWKLGLTTQIFLGLILGVLFGHLFPALAVDLKPIGDMFIRMIKMIVVPLIFSSLIMGIAGTGDFKKLGRLGLKSIIWFEAATTLALVVGLTVVNVFEPGQGLQITATDAAAVTAASKKSIDMSHMLINIVPTNVVDAAARGDMLQIIMFSVFFGVAAAAVGSKGEPVVKVAVSIAEVMFQFTSYVMRLAPIGVFALIGFTVGKFGLGMLVPLAKLIGSLYFALIVFVLLVLTIASLLIRVNFFHLLRALKEPLLIAFSTASAPAFVKKIFLKPAGAISRIFCAAKPRALFACAGAIVANSCTCSIMPAMTLGCWWPTLVLINWLLKSKYSLPSKSHKVQPLPVLNESGFNWFCTDQE